jgi:hypothetical protein
MVSRRSPTRSRTSRSSRTRHATEIGAFEEQSFYATVVDGMARTLPFGLRRNRCNERG